MIPEEGIYLGTLVEAGVDEVGDKKSLRMYLSYNITHQSDGEDWQEVEKPFTRDIALWLTEKAFAGTMELLDQMGHNGDFVEPEFGNDDVRENAQLECSHEEYEGKTKDRWELVEYRSGFQRKKADDKTLRQLQARAKTWRSGKKPPAGKPAKVPA